MSKADTLLKKATFFERIALYSDRKAFLQAIAQESQAQQSDSNRQIIWQALQILQQAGIDEATTKPLADAVTFGRVDIPAIQAAIQAAYLTKMSPLSQQAQIEQLKQLSSQLQAPMTEAEKGMAGPADVTFAPDSITGFQHIDPAKQAALGRIVEIEGLAFVDPKQLHDGRLGKETRKALTAFKNWVKQPNMSDAQALDMAAQMATQPKYLG
jgi:hypothetical protein